MEATALSLAKLTLETVLPVAKQAIANDALLLLGVRQEVSFIANELEMMQAFLRAADTSDRARNEVVKIWVQQVRDLAYDVEDCLQEYLALDLPAAGTGTGCSPWICCLWFAVGGLDNNRHRIAAWIREIKAGVEEVSKRNLRYSIVLQPGRVVDPAASREHAISISPTFADDVAAEECSLVSAPLRHQYLKS
jgi:disease resistance protein RPM1